MNNIISVKDAKFEKLNNILLENLKDTNFFMQLFALLLNEMFNLGLTNEEERNYLMAWISNEIRDRCEFDEIMMADRFYLLNSYIVEKTPAYVAEKFLNRQVVEVLDESEKSFGLLVSRFEELSNEINILIGKIGFKSLKACLEWINNDLSKLKTFKNINFKSQHSSSIGYTYILMYEKNVNAIDVLSRKVQWLENFRLELSLLNKFDTKSLNGFVSEIIRKNEKYVLTQTAKLEAWYRDKLKSIDDWYNQQLEKSKEEDKIWEKLDAEYGDEEIPEDVMPEFIDMIAVERKCKVRKANLNRQMSTLENGLEKILKNKDKVSDLENMDFMAFAKLLYIFMLSNDPNNSFTYPKTVDELFKGLNKCLEFDALINFEQCFELTDEEAGYLNASISKYSN